MLSIDYTSMFAHDYLQETYKIFGDTLSQQKYEGIEFKLLYSIRKSGDGRTCENRLARNASRGRIFCFKFFLVQISKNRV